MKLKYLFLILILLLPLATAYNGYYGSPSPSDLLQNEWVISTLIFLVFFALIFFSLSKTMEGNIAALTIISIVVSLFITMAISQRVRFYDYLGAEIGTWALLLALILIFIVVLRSITAFVGGFGLFVTLGFLWFLMNQVDPYELFPYDFILSDLFEIWQFLASQTFLILLIILLIILLAIAHLSDGDFNKAVRKWLWPSKKEKSLVDRLFNPN